MKNFIHFIIICISSCLSCLCMDTPETKILTSDNKEMTLPQSKIERMRLLHRKQQLQLVQEKYYQATPTPIPLKTISSQKLKLISDALDAQDFSVYFKSLGAQDWQPEQKLNISEDQRLLICAAGKQELDVPCITQRLAKICLSSDVFEHVSSYVSVSKAIDYLQYAITFDNCKQKNFTPQTNCYDGKGKKCFIPMGTEYKILPKLLEHQTNFSGKSPIMGIKMERLSQEAEASNKEWWLDNYVLNQNLDMYFLTPIEPIKDFEEELKPNNKKKLWTSLNQENKLLTKIITHSKSPIIFSAFSKNGKYLATSSKGPHSELVFTDLSIQNQTFTHPDVILTGINGAIDQISFNSKSTLLAVLSEKKIYFYNLQTHTLLTTLNYPLQDDNCIEFTFNNEDSRLAITSWNDATFTSNVMLYDVTNINNIALVKDIKLEHLIVENAHFTPSDNKLIIETTQNVILLSGKTGNKIMETERLQNNNHNGWIYGVLIELSNILVTLNHPADSDQYSIKLWDINSGNLIATLEQKIDLEGIGITENSRSIVGINELCKMIQIDLYNDTIANTLDWSRHKMNLFEKSLLLKIWRASKMNESVSLDPGSFESHTLQELPVDFKTLVEKYLRPFCS